jgi:hypothetical protein
MKKQSSIEWLINEMINQMGLRIENTEIGKQLVEKAKEMHKEEIIDACEEFGNLNGVDIEDYEQYYTETYKN